MKRTTDIRLLGQVVVVISDPTYGLENTQPILRTALGVAVHFSTTFITQIPHNNIGAHNSQSLR